MGGRLVVLALVCAVSACAGCGRSHANPAPDAGAPARGITPELASQVLARVGDRTITVGDYAAALEHMDQFDRMRYQAPERRQELLAEMIDVYLLADEARAQGYDRDPVTEQEIREILRDAMLQRVRQGMPGPSDVPDQEIHDYYDQHRADFRDPERRRVSAIVLSSEAGSAALLDAARKASALQWGELVRARSTDPRARSGAPADLAGDLGFVSPPGDTRGISPRMPDEVRAAAFEIAKVGDVLPRVVRTSQGFYILKLTARTEPHDRTLEEARRAIAVKLAQQKIQAKEDELLDDLRRRYPVQIDEAALGDVKVELPAADAGR